MKKDKKLIVKTARQAKAIREQTHKAKQFDKQIKRASRR